jgi:DNA-binding beta-propeller fold protein YncE
MYFIAFSTVIFIASCIGDNSNKKNVKIEKDTGSTSEGPLFLRATIKLSNVKGGFDLMSIDPKGHRLFLAAEDNHTVEIIDLVSFKSAISLPGFDEPKWIVYRPESNKIYVSTGGDGKVTILDATSYKTLNTYSFREKCNNLRFDSSSQQLYVGVGSSFGSIGIIDVRSDKIVGEIPLSGFPKQFEIDSNRIYVNIPFKNSIDVIDRSENKVVANWPVDESTENVPMALDRIRHRLFIACNPGKFLAFNTETGKSIANLTIGTNADGIYLDAKRSLIYISCGEGLIEVISQKDADHYSLLGHVKTVKGAGTSLFSPVLDQFFLAVPQTENNPAELRVYKTFN